MFWNKKESDKKRLLPDLPPLGPNLNSPQIQSVRPFPAPPEEENPEGNKLPAFPESAVHDKFSQVAIKEAIKDEKGPEFPSENEKTFKKDLEDAEEEEWDSDAEPAEKKIPIQEIDSAYRESGETLDFTKTDKKEVFVKIDKFRAAKKSLGLISKDIEDMDSLIKKIRETKMREDQEFASWESSVESIKSRIKNVRENIFERL